MIYFFLDFVNIFRQKIKKELIFIDRLFIADVTRELKVRKWTYKDLAKATGQKVSYINAFMCGLRYNESVKKSIAAALEIEI